MVFTDWKREIRGYDYGHLYETGNTNYSGKERHEWQVICKVVANEVSGS